MNKRDVEKLDIRMQTIRNCFKKDMEAIDEILEKTEGRFLREQGVDYVIEYIKEKLCTLHLDMAMFNRTLDREMKECFYYLNEMVEGESAPEKKTAFQEEESVYAKAIATRRGFAQIPWEKLMEDENVSDQCPVVRFLKEHTEKMEKSSLFMDFGV